MVDFDGLRSGRDLGGLRERKKTLKRKMHKARRVRRQRKRKRNQKMKMVQTTTRTRGPRSRARRREMRRPKNLHV